MHNQNRKNFFFSKKMKFLTMMIMAGLLGTSVLGKQPDSDSNSQADSGYFEKNICIPVWGEDLIINGNFQNNKCTVSYGFCFWNTFTFVPEDLPGWEPDTEMQIGKAYQYNSNWPSKTTNFVMELDPNINQCIKQSLILKKGTYNLSFNWAARANKPFQTSKVDVKVNGQTITQLPQATNFQIQTANILFVLKKSVYNGFIQLCGAGTSDSFGASVDNIKLIFYNNCK